MKISCSLMNVFVTYAIKLLETELCENTASINFSLSFILRFLFYFSVFPSDKEHVQYDFNIQLYCLFFVNEAIIWSNYCICNLSNCTIQNRVT